MRSGVGGDALGVLPYGAGVDGADSVSVAVVVLVGVPDVPVMVMTCDGALPPTDRVSAPGVPGGLAVSIGVGLLGVTVWTV